jgi:FkbM family methyltransferase
MKIPRPVYRGLRKYIHPLIPPRQRLGFTYWVCRLAGKIEPELLNLEYITRTLRKGTAIDVGANCGLWSYGMARVFRRVYAFEANEDVATDLRSSQHRNIQLEICGLSSAKGEATLFVPFKDNVKLTGWASLQHGNCPDTDRHIEKKVQLKTLDSFGIEGVSFIKIDTEGHELEVLRGAIGTITTNRPVAIIEVMDRNREGVSDYFQQLDYEELPLNNPSQVQNLLTMRLYSPKSTLP